MKKCILLTTLSILVVFASVVSAGKKQEARNDRQDIKQSKKQINYTIVAFNNLSLAIDFWHDATLKGDRKAIAEHKEMIHEIISEDIKDSYKSVTYAKLEASYSKDEFKNNKNKKAKADDKYDFKDDKRDLKNEETILRAKQRLYDSLQKSKSFAYSYRLLADYQQLLKNELEANKVELAEDVNELKEDAGRARLIR